MHLIKLAYLPLCGRECKNAEVWLRLFVRKIQPDDAKLCWISLRNTLVHITLRNNKLCSFIYTAEIATKQGLMKMYQTYLAIYSGVMHVSYASRKIRKNNNFFFLNMFNLITVLSLFYCKDRRQWMVYKTFKVKGGSALGEVSLFNKYNN